MSTINEQIDALVAAGNALDNILVNDGNDAWGDDCAITTAQADAIRAEWASDDQDVSDLPELPAAREWRAVARSASRKEMQSALDTESNRVTVTTMGGEEIEIFRGTHITCESIAEKVYGRIGQKYQSVRHEKSDSGEWVVYTEFEY